MSAPSTPQWLVVVKDATAFGLGVVGLSVQLWTDHVNPMLFGVFAALVGTPGFSAAVWLARATPPADGRPSPPDSTPSTGTDSPSAPSPSAP